ncbi:Tim44 domain-containing protein [Phenylobacterium sp.]|jgi:predicted lipid-binding transport protein (Tim44 family)|uniref:Tim44 domain-containing protein n=1 Tax=Phenylobacterium sp. TaxID=1871053 RepID=UPI002F3F2EF0
MTKTRSIDRSSLKTKFVAALGIALAVGLLAASPADARRGGSFGSRGSRTYSQPAPTATAPGYTGPVQRSMTAPGGTTYQPGYRPGYAPGYAPGFGYNRSPFGGFLGGLVAGGLIGGLLSGGHHWGGGWGGYGWGGGGGGLLTIIIQLVVLFFVINLVMRMFRRRAGYEEPMFAGPGPSSSSFLGGAPSFGGGPRPGYGGGYGGTAVPPTAGWDIPISPQDQQAFERLLMEIQDAYAHEDYARLRERCTPEVMGYLAEELSDNATHGRKNDVTGTRLLQADVGEAWREGDTDYATASMKFESIDIMRDRSTGAVLSGDPNTPTQAVEMWTFARHTGGDWKLSAIQT